MPTDTDRATRYWSLMRAGYYGKLHFVRPREAKDPLKATCACGRPKLLRPTWKDETTLEEALETYGDEVSSHCARAVRQAGRGVRA